MSDVLVHQDGHVGVVELRRPPHNFVDPTVLGALADAVESLDGDPGCRAIVLAAEGKSFCAGANFASGGTVGGDGGDGDGGDFRSSARRFYDQALRLFAVATPMVAAVHGAAVGGGLGLALVPDVRVTCPEARFTANFVKLGIHPGFGLSVTLPELVGPSRAADLFLTGRRVGGEEALRLGLADRCVPPASVRAAAVELADEIAAAAPLAVAAVRATLRRGLVDRVRAALDHELEEQARLVATDDAREGMTAVFSRRHPTFHGR
jgi:enoyl-CoA hydratase/carnithine racemase